ncbi:hypothetical protein NJC38_22750 [Pseudomonas sp. 21LCFQ010]|uniref:T6SS effector BTH_I2691 family protein n=1 Tax=Pseudomonas sp. 21LCFQ010 TaxID=2957506 RepID=UPI00209751DC|nr:T6SS effector BTH_I2691 family protein [Pseudomonas sp. 21LCFQ010]MCO8164963.1 hypothetical protein [Pseudomonas sp. 21LCFQ010]
MNQKLGTPRQRCANEFSRTPLSGTSLCPFKGPEIAIVPVRYALDRSRYDVNPNVLKPLARNARWARLPPLKSRSYTLRQLHEGFVYVFDETAGTLHEYAYSAHNAHLQRIKWSSAHIGQNERSGSDAGLPYLSYPRDHVLHIAFAPLQWTWRICERLRSHEDSRKRWMKRLDLSSYSLTMNEPGTLPLAELATAVADIDAGQVTDDGRFDDTAIPSREPDRTPEEPPQDEWVTLGADVHWLGNVPDKDSALLIALDDPLTLVRDLGMQMAGDIAALQRWEAEYEHRLKIAGDVIHLCGTTAALSKAEEADPYLAQQYLIDAEGYLEQYELEERIYEENATVAPEAVEMFRGPHHRNRRSATLLQGLIEKYGKAPNQADIDTWLERSKWRREIDLKAARQCLQQQQPVHEQLLQRVRDTRTDIQNWALHIGLEPDALFMDTGYPKTLLYLQTIKENLTIILEQDKETLKWLTAQENKATTLFGTQRYGFSPAIKAALDTEANKLLAGMGDVTNLGTRIGELNNALNHRDFANSAWYKALDATAQATLKAMQELASGAGKAIAQGMLSAAMITNTRLSKKEPTTLAILLRNLLIGQLLGNTPEGLSINRQFVTHLKEWKRLEALHAQQLRSMRNAWSQPVYRHDRRNMGLQLQAQEDRIRAYAMKLPDLLDFKNQRHAEQFKQEMYSFFQSGKNVVKDWSKQVRQWSQRLGIHGAGISWTVITLNLFNTAFVWSDITRDGKIDGKDLRKLGYNLGYSLNLMMVLYLEAPWQVVRNAKPITIYTKSISIMSRSAAYWKVQGKPDWATAVRGFRVRAFAAGVVGGLGAFLEVWELRDDIENAKTSLEKDLLRVKSFGAVLMGIIMTAPVLSALFTGNFAIGTAALALGGWAAVGVAIGGLIYLIASKLLNNLKQDNIGVWLRRCCWSFTSENRYADTAAGQAEEIRAFMEVQLCPQILVKSTHSTEFIYTGKNHVPVNTQNGAWVQIRFPEQVRGSSVLFEVISSKKQFHFFTAIKVDTSIRENFKSNGVYKPISEWGNITTQRPSHDYPPPFIPEIKDEQDILWHTWIPLASDASYLELQIWYPNDVVHPSPSDAGYLYQIELDSSGTESMDGLSKVELLVKNSNRDKAGQLFFTT